MSQTTLVDNIKCISGRFTIPSYEEMYKPFVSVFADSSSGDNIESTVKILHKIAEKTPIDVLFSCSMGTSVRDISAFKSEYSGKLDWTRLFETATGYINAMSIRPLELVFIMGSPPEVTSGYIAALQRFLTAANTKVIRVHCISFDADLTKLMFSLSRIGSSPGVLLTVQEGETVDVTTLLSTMLTPAPRITLISGDNMYPAFSVWNKTHAEYYLFGLPNIINTIDKVHIDSGLGVIRSDIVLDDVASTSIDNGLCFRTFQYAVLLAAAGNHEEFLKVKDLTQKHITFREPNRLNIMYFLDAITKMETPDYMLLSTAIRERPIARETPKITLPPPEKYAVTQGEKYEDILQRGDFIVYGEDGFTTFDRVTFEQGIQKVFPLPLYINEEHAKVVASRISEYVPDVLMQNIIKAASLEYSKLSPDEEVLVTIRWLYRILQPDLLPFPGVLGTNERSRISIDLKNTLIVYCIADQKPTEYMVIAAIEEHCRRQLEKFQHEREDVIEKIIWKLLDLSELNIDWNIAHSIKYKSPAESLLCVDPVKQFGVILDRDPELILSNLSTPDEYFIFESAAELQHLYFLLFGKAYSPTPYQHVAMCLQNMLQASNRIRANALHSMPHMIPLGSTTPYNLGKIDFKTYTDFITPGGDARALLYLQTLFKRLCVSNLPVVKGDLELFTNTTDLALAAAVIEGKKREQAHTLLNLFEKPVNCCVEKYRMIILGSYNGIILYSDGVPEINKIKSSRLQKYKTANPTLSILDGFTK